MKKIMLIAALFLGINSYAQEISFEKETIDYGTIEKSTDGVRVFLFKNTGKDALIITNAVGSCGCTVPTYPSEPIPPNGEAQITVEYDTKRVGTFSKQVKIYSNATNANPVKLKVKGNVVEPAS